MTKYLDLKKDYQKEDLTLAAENIKEGNLVLFPTETVYGIGAKGLNSDAVKKIFIAKGRASDNPLILHVSSIKMVDSIAKDITPLERQLMEAFFPGPLTIILKRKDNVPDIVTASLDTVGIRMPLNNKVDYIIDGGDTDIGLESTVIRVINNVIHILRPGKITKKDLEKYAKVEIDSHVLGDIKNNEKVLSPGMKYKHYAPNTKCILVYSDNKEKMYNKIKSLEDTNTIVICNSSNVSNYKKAIPYGYTEEEISHNIFKILREIDKKEASLVIIEGVKEEGLGLAIMNRLIRACSHNYIKI